MSGLSARHQRFVAEYLIDQNASAAYKRAGYAARGASADTNAVRLLRNAQIRAAIDAGLSKALGKVELTAERTLLELARLSFADIGDLVDAQGRALPLHKIPEDLRRCIVGVKWKDGEPEYKIADKNTALGNALKVLGLLREKIEVEDTTPEKVDPTDLARRLAFVFSAGLNNEPRTIQ